MSQNINFFKPHCHRQLQVNDIIKRYNFILLSLEWRYALKVVAFLPFRSSVYVNYVISCKKEQKGIRNPGCTKQIIQDNYGSMQFSIRSWKKKTVRETTLEVFENKHQNKWLIIFTSRKNANSSTNKKYNTLHSWVRKTTL